MHIMTQTSDGFIIAEEDLKMRGPGDIYGTRQSGALDFKIADIINDVDIIEETKAAAQLILNQDPYLEHPQHAALRKDIQKNRNKQVQQWSKIS